MSLHSLRPSTFLLSLSFLSFLSFSSLEIEAHSSTCTGEVGEFKCVNHNGMWAQRCIRNNRVCDGQYDCADHSDEWAYLCDHKCYFINNDDYQIYTGFSCDIRRTSLYNGTGLDDLNQSSNHSGTHNANSNNQVHGHTHTVEETSTGQPGSDQDSNSSTPSPVPNDWWISTTSTTIDDRCLPLSVYCDYDWDCWGMESGTKPVDERNCRCDQNEECTSRHSPGDSWWMRILATTVGIVVLFGFCVCAAIQWEKHRTTLNMRRRERQLEAVNRRTAPRNGQLNMGVNLDPTEFQARVGNACGTTVAPPPYSPAIGFPKPDDRGLPPPYQPEWVPDYCPPTAVSGYCPATAVHPIPGYSSQAAAAVDPNIGPITFFAINQVAASPYSLSAADTPPAATFTSTPASAVAPASVNTPASGPAVIDHGSTGSSSPNRSDDLINSTCI